MGRREPAAGRRRTMPKIESIRPGGTLDATFATYPLAELLLGILRGNLTGRLDVFLHPEPRNRVHFRDGVPIVVDLPDGPLSLIQLLISEDRIREDTGLELLREGESSGHSAADVIRRAELLSQVDLHQAQVRWARRQLVKLFDAGPIEFRFVEGIQALEDGILTILQPLPIVYEGLRHARDRSVVQRFLAKHIESRFTLSATYPRNVDPFEWGPSVETALESLHFPARLADLERAGLEPDCAAAVLTALHLTDMVDLREAGRPRGLTTSSASSASASMSGPKSGHQGRRIEATSSPSDPLDAPAGASAVRPTAAPSGPAAGLASAGGALPSSPNVAADVDEAASPGVAEPAWSASERAPPGTASPSSPSGGPGGVAGGGEGLVVHRRSSGAIDTRPPVVRVTSQIRTEAAVGGNAHDREYVAVRDRLTPYFGQNYFQILRVSADTDAAQLDRAYRFLVRRFEEDIDRQGAGPVLDLLHEAYEVLKDGESARRYAHLVERGEKLSPIDRERRAVEAEPKVDRAVRAMGAGRTGEATLLLSWAERLDPSRSDLSAYFGVLDVIRAPDGQRAADARALLGMLQEQVELNAYDWRLKLCMALALAEDGEFRAAAMIMDQTPDLSHPMALRITKILEAS